MREQNDQLYYQRRITEERRRSEQAQDVLVARVHMSLAAEYEKRLEMETSNT